MSNKVAVSIRNALSSDLALRIIADNFLNFIEALDVKEIVIDFKGVSSISRSFAHQYVQRKQSSRKEIAEINVPNNVMKMFEVVISPKKETIFEVEEVKPLLV